MAETTRLITELILKDEFTTKANAAASASDHLAQKISSLKRAAGAGASGGGAGVGGGVGIAGAAAGGAGLARMFSGSSKLLAGIAGAGVFGINSMIRSASGGGGLIASILSFLPRLASSLISVLSLLSLLNVKFGLFIALGLQIARIPFEILGSVLSVVGQAVEKLIGFLGELAQKLVGFLGEVASGLINFSMSAINISNTFDTLRRTMAGFLGGRAQGEQGARFLQQYGLESPFEQQPIFEAARVLLTVGLKLDRFLPVVERLALFAGGSPEALREIVELLMRAVGGQTGLVFGARGLGRFGITQELLKESGATFGANNQFQGGAEEAVKVFEKLSELPFILSIADFMRESNAVAFSNALDAINAVLIEIGDKLNSFIVPLIRKASELIIKIVRGGFIDRFLQMVAGVFNPDIGDGWSILESVIKNIAAGILSVFDAVKILFAQTPELIKAAFDLIIGYAENALEFILYNIKKAIIDFITYAFKFLPFGENFRDLLFESVPKPEYVDTSERFSRVLETLSQIGGDIAGIFNDNKRAVDEMIQSGDKLMQGVDDPSQHRLVSEFDELIDATKGVEENTRQIADMQKHILGGGDIGRLGITPIEMRNLNRRININVNANDSDVMRFLLPIIRDAITQYEKQRSLGFQR